MLILLKNPNRAKYDDFRGLENTLPAFEKRDSGHFKAINLRRESWHPNWLLKTGVFQRNQMLRACCPNRRDPNSPPGDVCRSSLLRSLRPDDRVPAHERYRSTGKSREIRAERLPFALNSLASQLTRSYPRRSTFDVAPPTRSILTSSFEVSRRPRAILS